MSHMIIRTLDSKLLQDTIAGRILTPFRPHLVENNNFIDQRLNKTEHRPAELKVLKHDAPEGLTDAILEQGFYAYRDECHAEGKDSSFEAFVKALGKYCEVKKVSKPGAPAQGGKAQKAE